MYTSTREWECTWERVELGKEVITRDAELTHPGSDLDMNYITRYISWKPVPFGAWHEGNNVCKPNWHLATS